MYFIALLIGLTISPVFAKNLAVPRGIAEWEKFDGPCPSEVDSIKNFNHTQFEGFWYVIQRYEQGRYIDCASAKYVWTDNDRRFIETLRSINLENGGSASTLTILFEREAFPNEGQFYVAFDDTNDYYFVDTDYDKYAVIWSCYNDHNLEHSFQNMMVLAKDRYFDINSLESLNATLAKPTFDRTRLQNIEHKNDRCVYYP